MKNLNNVASDLFNKIRGRFPSVTIGDSEGTITTVPEESRFYDFAFTSEGAEAGKVSISLDEENGVTVIIGNDIIENQPQSVKTKWFNFLRELRQFAKKRMLQFDVRDITKSNLKKRDYKHLAATRPGEETMAESKMYGTNKTSYQRIGNAKLAIKHTAPINTENLTSRTQKIGSIFIESPNGEKFRYPFVHLSGARAMARHVSEGGNAYDDFGKYISSLSEELGKLRKFNTYVNRSGVMAETLGGYTDIVKERSAVIRKEIQNLQKENYYKETVEGFSAPIVEDVPEDIAENWIDQLTIRQFNEELKDVFPYIYKLVGEATKAKALGPEELDEISKKTLGSYVKKASSDMANNAYNLGARDPLKKTGSWNKAFKRKSGIEKATDRLTKEEDDPCWSGYKQVGMKEKGGKKVPNCVPESQEISEDRYRTNKKFKLAVDNHKNYKIYVSKDRIVQNKFLATAISITSDKEVEDAKSLGKTAKDAVSQVMQNLDDRTEKAQKVTSDATLDFNVMFTHDLLNNDASDLGIEKIDDIYVKVVPGPKLLIANMYVWGEVIDLLKKDAKFSKGSNRVKTGNALVGARLSAAQAVNADLVANGRYILGTPKPVYDKQIDDKTFAYYEYPMMFDSVVIDKNDNVKFPKPAVTIGTRRLESSFESEIDSYYESLLGRFGSDQTESNYPDGMDHSYLDGEFDDEVDRIIDDGKEEILYDIKNYDVEILKDLANPNNYEPEQAADELSDLAMEVVVSFSKRYDDDVADAIRDELYKYARELLQKKFSQVNQKETTKVSSNSKKVTLEKDYNFSPDDLQQLQRMKSVDDVKRKAIELISTQSNKPMKPEKVAWFKRQIDSKRSPMDVIKLMYDLMLSGDGNAVIGSKGSMGRNSYRRIFGDDDEMDVKISPQGMSKADIEPEKPKTPLGEFILSYFDRETGKFPKGETAVLTAVEKDYGDEYVEPARQFIEKVESTTLEYLQREESQSRYPETAAIKRLAGI
jgi:hypothetical protein